MPATRTSAPHVSAGVILVDPLGRVLLQLRDDDPAIMFPGHWGITGGAAHPGEAPEQAARREVAEETGIELDRFEPFRAYYGPAASRGRGARNGPEHALYLFHAPCRTPAAEMVCGEGRELRFFAPAELEPLDLAYNHREVLADFFASTCYAAYLSGAAFDDTGGVDPLARFIEQLDAGAPWFDALMDAVAAWERPEEEVGGRRYRYLVGGEAFDWLLLAERLLGEAGDRVPSPEAAALLFHGTPPGDGGRPLDDARLRGLIGEAKHRAHLNFIYGVTVEEALQYAVELDLQKERVTLTIRNRWEVQEERDPVFQRIYGKGRGALLAEFRAATQARARGLPAGISHAEHREFLYWLFRYRVQNTEPARVASDTRKALAALSAIEDGVRRSGRRASLVPARE
jgi:8-oxo-dGTP pyrophosphatase MutT (NUDIX family)